MAGCAFRALQARQNLQTLWEQGKTAKDLPPARSSTTMEPCIVLERRRDGALLLGVEWVKHCFGDTNNLANDACCLLYFITGCAARACLRRLEMV